MAGLHPNYLTMLTSEKLGSNPVLEKQQEIAALIMDESSDMNKVLHVLGRKAISVMNKLMDSPNERISLDAAKEIASKSSETAGIMKHEMAGFTLGDQDAKILAQAMVESAMLASRHNDVALHGLVEVDVTQGAEHAVAPAASDTTSKS